MESPKTPEQDPILKEPCTEERAAYKWHVEHRRHDETLEDVAAAHGINRRTGQRWRKEFAHFGDCRRVRKKKAKEKGTKLGRKWTVALEKMKELVDDDKHHNCEAPLPVQAAQVGGIPLAPRTLQYNLSKRLHAHLYVAAVAEDISEQNKSKRVNYGYFHKHHTITNY